MKTQNLLQISVVLSLVVVTAVSLAKSANRSRVVSYKSSSKIPHRSSALKSLKINNIQFNFNQAAVPQNSHAELNKLAKIMIDSSVSLKVSGYADNKGGYVYNWKLSQKRAEAVKSYLVSKGADSSKIAATEYGYTHPIASNASPAGRQKNRRVEIRFAN